jgi:hypothetical protein
VWRWRCHLVCGLAAEERPLALFAWHRDVASQAVSQALSILGQVNKSRENEDPRVTITVVITPLLNPFTGLLLRIQRFGGPEVLAPDEVEPSLPDASQVLVAVRAASVNPVGAGDRQGGSRRTPPRGFGLKPSRRPADGLAGSVEGARTPSADAGVRNDPPLLICLPTRLSPK